MLICQLMETVQHSLGQLLHGFVLLNSNQHVYAFVSGDSEPDDGLLHSQLNLIINNYNYDSQHCSKGN